MNVTALTAPTTASSWKRVGWIVLVLGGLFAASNAVMFMLVGGHGSPEIKERFFATAIAGWSHAFGGAIAALIGPFQMLSVVRRSWPRVHVWMGRTYLLAVLAGGLAGLYFAPISSAGIVGRVGFATLAVFWLFSGTRAYLAIRRGNVQEHRRWMLRVAIRVRESIRRPVLPGRFSPVAAARTSNTDRRRARQCSALSSRREDAA